MRNPVYLLLLLTVLPLWARRSPVPDADAVRKAEYVFLEAYAQPFDSTPGTQYFLLRHAAAINPDDPYIAGALAEIEFLMPGVSEARREKSYDALRRRFLAEPANSNYADMFSRAARAMRRPDDMVAAYELHSAAIPANNEAAVQLAMTLTERFDARGDTADIDRALAICRDVESRVGRNFRTTALSTYINSTMGDTAAVVDDIRALVADAPSDPRNLLMAGTLYTQNDMPDSALAVFDRAAGLAPHQGVINAARADIYLRNGRDSAFRAEARAAILSEDLDFDRKQAILQNYVEEVFNDSTATADTDSLFGVVMDLHPGQPQLHDLYAAYLTALERYADAAEQYALSNDLDRGNDRRLAEMVRLNFLDDKPQRARDIALGAMADFPANGYFPVAVASAYVNIDPQAGVAFIDSLDMTAYTDNVKSILHSTLGDLLWQQRNFDAASEAYHKAFSEDLTNYGAMNNYAYACAEADRDLIDAEQYASMAVGAEPENHTYIDTYAWVMYRKGMYAVAKQLIEKAIGLAEKDTGASAELYDHAGDINFALGDTDTAVAFWQKALNLTPDSDIIRRKIEERRIIENE